MLTRRQRDMLNETKKLKDNYNYHKKRAESNSMFFNKQTQQYEKYSDTSRYFSQGYVACVEEAVKK